MSIERLTSRPRTEHDPSRATHGNGDGSFAATLEAATRPTGEPTDAALLGLLLAAGGPCVATWPQAATEDQPLSTVAATVCRAVESARSIGRGTSFETRIAFDDAGTVVLGVHETGRGLDVTLAAPPLAAATLAREMTTLVRRLEARGLRIRSWRVAESRPRGAGGRR